MKQTGMLRCAVLVCTLLCLLPCCTAQAEVTLEASVGYGQTILDGRWFPLEVIIGNDGEALSGELSVNLMQDEDAYDRYVYPVTVGAGETVSVRFPISTLIPQRSFEIELCAGGLPVAVTTPEADAVVETDAYVIALLGGDESLAESMTVSRSRDILERKELITVLPVDKALFALSDKELSAFQAIAFCGFDAGTLSEAQQERLDTWLRSGGTALVGPTCGQTDSADWFAVRTGVRMGEMTESSGITAALLRYSMAASEEENDPQRIFPLDAGGDAQVFDASGRCILAASRYGSGLVITCGFDWMDPSILRAARENALWQRLLLTVDAAQYYGSFSETHRRNAHYSTSLNALQRVSEGVSIAPGVIALTAYVLLAGAGLYAAMRRLDRSKLLWVCLPALSLAGVVLVMCIGAALDLDEPTASSLTVTHIDEKGSITTEELALVAFPDASPVTLSGEHGETIERQEYGYFYTWGTRTAQPSLRDTVTLGDSPSLTLSGAAPWLARTIVVKRAAPQGGLSASARMEADGLHVLIDNGLEVSLENAVLLTSFGYASIGHIASGETCEAHLVRLPQPTKGANGMQSIGEGELLEYPVTLSDVIQACCSPLSPTDGTGTQAAPDEDAKRAYDLMYAKLRLAIDTSQERFDFVLAAECPDVACTALYKDGRQITRFAQESVLTADVVFSPVSESGYFFRTVGAQQIREENGTFVRCGEFEENCLDAEKAIFGYDLSAMDGGDIQSIRITTQVYGYSGNAVYLEVYDCTVKDWVQAGFANQCSLDASLTGRVIDDNGLLMLRCVTKDPSYSANVAVPTVMVEGSEAV